ncbi:MAG: PAS domain S-box protein [Nitrospirota bacterium]
MFDLSAFRLQDMALCSTTIRRLGEGATSIEDVADRITRFLYTTLTTGPDENPACVLVRAFKTHPYERLAPELQALADARLGGIPASPGMKCLTLLGSTGAVTGWNNPALSSRFRVIPLAGPEALAQLPMFAQLFAQFHVNVSGIQNTSTSLLLDQRTAAFNAFHVPHAVNSPYVPGQQDFVLPFGVQSVFGCGGLLPTGAMFALVLFAKIPVSKDTADLFRTIALSVKLALAPFEHTQLILPTTAASSDAGHTQAPVTLAALQDRVATLEAILTSQEQTIEVQSRCLEDTLAEAVKQGQKLQKHSMRFETLSATSPVGIFETDAEGACLYTNATWQAISGLTLAETLGDGWSRAILDQDRHRVCATWDQIAQAGGECSLEFRMQRPDGTIRWVHARSRPLTDKAGQVTGHVGTTEDITERKRVEEALRESETRLREAQAMARLGNWELDLVNDRLLWSDEIFRIFEIDQAQFSASYEAFLNAVHPDDRALANDAYTQSVQNHTPYEIVHRLQMADGRIKYVQERGKTHYDREGRPQRSVGTVQDITERQQADEALRQSEEHFRLTLDVATDGFWDWDLPTHQASYSPRWIRLLGLEDHDIPLNNMNDWKTRVHPDDRAMVERALTDHLEGRSSGFSAEHRIRHRSGAWTWFAMRGQITHRDEQGRPVRMMGTMVDITDRKKSEAARFRLQQAINHAQDGMALLDDAGEYLYMNPAHAAIYGYRVDELLGRSWKDLYHPEWATMVEQMYFPSLHADGQWQGEVVGKKKSGDAFHLDLSLTLLEEPGTGRQTTLCTCRDITRRKQLECDLTDSKDAAEAAARAKAEFLATMSHEIRTPMNGVIGMTGLLLDTSLTPEQREYAETVRRSGEALLAIINDILDFSKIEAGKLALEIIEFDLRTTVEETLDLLAEPAQRKDLEVVGLVDGAVPAAVKGDPGRLRQILTNLLGNAIKFTERGEVVLALSVLKASDRSVTLRFSVTDTGVGITPEGRARLFQSFSQADGSTTRRFGGTGLGLAISKQLVELMRGEIGVDSRPGAGSTFWFTIDLEQPPHRPASPTPAQDLAGLRVCLIDDNATNRRLLEHHARSWGMTHASAGDGPTGLALIQDAHRSGHPFDLAIIDMQMPGMDGMRLAEAITATTGATRTRLVLLTSLTRRGDAKLAQQRGFSAYLTKPIRQHQLYDSLRLVMGGSPAKTPQKSPLITVHSLAETRAKINGRLLLAEDNVINQKVAVKMLEKLGCHVDVVADGREAVEALSRIPYALIFMDCQMPEMDGFEATRRIRQREGTARHTPIIAMTANAMASDREQCLAAGMDDYLSKPVKSQDLHRVLTQWLPPSDNRAAA